MKHFLSLLFMISLLSIPSVSHAYSFLNVDQNIPDFNTLFSGSVDSEDCEIYEERPVIESTVLNYLNLTGTIVDEVFLCSEAFPSGAKNLFHAEIRLDSNSDPLSYTKIQFSGYYYEDFYLSDINVTQEYHYEQFFSNDERSKLDYVLMKIVADFETKKITDRKVWVAIEITDFEENNIPKDYFEKLASSDYCDEHGKEVYANLDNIDYEKYIFKNDYGCTYLAKLDLSKIRSILKKPLSFISYFGENIPWSTVAEFNYLLDISALKLSLNDSNIPAIFYPSKMVVEGYYDLTEKYFLRVDGDSTGTDLFEMGFTIQPYAKYSGVSGYQTDYYLKISQEEAESAKGKASKIISDLILELSENRIGDVNFVDYSTGDMNRFSFKYSLILKSEDLLSHRFHLEKKLLWDEYRRDNLLFFSRGPQLFINKQENGYYISGIIGEKKSVVAISSIERENNLAKLKDFLDRHIALNIVLENNLDFISGFDQIGVKIRNTNLDIYRTLGKNNARENYSFTLDDIFNDGFSDAISELDNGVEGEEFEAIINGTGFIFYSEYSPKRISSAQGQVNLDQITRLLINIIVGIIVSIGK